MRKTIAAVAALMVAMAISACGSSEDDSADSKSPTPSMTVAETPAADCETPSPAIVSQIEASLKVVGRYLAQVQSVEGPDGTTYISANLMEGDKRVSPMVVWATKGAALYAVSSSAQDASQLPDGSVIGVSAGDQYGSAVQQCVLKEVRGR